MGRSNEFHGGATGGPGDGTIQMDLEPVTAHVVAQYHAAHGGSSFFVHGGERAHHGWSVGGLQGMPETTVPSQTISPDQWQAHRDAVRSKISAPTAVAGSWAENGNSVMDASNVVGAREEAASLQRHREERAVWNLHENKEEDLR